MSSETAKPRATAVPRLEWQGELDSAMAEIDDRLTHPRRRSSDLARPPAAAAVGHIELTSEMLDEIAWRVAGQIRKNGESSTTETVSRALSQVAEADGPGLRPGKMLLIRYKLPVLPWPFRLLQRRYRKKQHPLTTARLRA